MDGSSTTTNSNDGLNCMEVESVFPPPTTTTQTTSRVVTTTFPKDNGKTKCVEGYIKQPGCECTGVAICEKCDINKHCNGRATTITSNEDRTKCICDGTTRTTTTTRVRAPLAAAQTSE